MDMPEDVKQHIIATALALFSKNGFARTSINDIVRASGLSKGGVYWHFASKDEIIVAIFQQFFDAQISMLRGVVQDASLNARQKLLRLTKLSGMDLEAMVSQFPSSLEFYALAARDTPLRNQLVGYFTVYEDLIEQILIQGTTNGEWRTLDPKSTARTIIAIFEGVLLVWGVLPGSFSLNVQLEQSLELLLNGMNHQNQEK